MNAKKINAAVNDFFDGKRYAYATPGTANHTANFYGDHYICKLTRSEVVSCIESAREWNWDKNDDPEKCAIEAILNDLQFELPRD